jgi:hypothetical protein
MLADHPQEAINKQLLDRADILCAVMGTRVGSPTQSYRSGTIEEISKFIDSERDTLGGHFVQIYFKKEKIDPTTINIDDLAQVRAFRDEISAKALFRDFLEADELASLVRRSLRACLRQFTNGATDAAPVVGDAPGAVPAESDEDDIDDGLFDLLAQHKAAADAAVHETDVIQTSFSGMNSRLDEVSSTLNTTGGLGIDAKALFSEAGDAIAKAADEIGTATPVLRARLLESIRALSGAVALSEEIGFSGPEQVEQLRLTVDQTLSAATTARLQIAQLYETTNAVPNYTKKFKKSSNLLTTCLRALLGFVNEAVDRLEALQHQLRPI